MSRYNTVGKVATSISKDDTHNIVTYHQTQVVRWNEKEIILNNGGWYTNTTKVRMNQASQQFNLGYSIYQKDGDWYCSFKGVDLPFQAGRAILTR